MKIGHPSEMELQLYVLDEPGCTAEVIGHIEQCAYCRASVSAYRLVLAEIKQQPRPAFDFEVADLVLAELPVIDSRLAVSPSPDSLIPPPRKDFFLYILVFGTLTSIGLPMYGYRAYLSKMLTGMLPMAICLIVMTAMIILLFYGMEMYRKYRRQLKALNY